MDLITDGFLNKVLVHYVYVRYKMSFLIPDVFVPLEDPTYNDILNHDNFDPDEDPFQLLTQDTDLLLAHVRVIPSLAAVRRRVYGSNPLLLQSSEQFGHRLFVTGINLDPNRVKTLASVNHFWFLVCVNQPMNVQFLALNRMIYLSNRWNIPASVRALDGDENFLLYEFSGRHLKLVSLISPLRERN